MKRLVGCILIVVLVIGFSLYGFHYSQSVADGITAAADEITDYFDNEDYEKALSSAKKAQELWQGISEHTIFVEDTSCDTEITMTLARICALAEKQDDEIIIECRTLKSLVDSFIDRQRLTFANVF